MKYITKKFKDCTINEIVLQCRKQQENEWEQCRNCPFFFVCSLGREDPITDKELDTEITLEVDE